MRSIVGLGNMQECLVLNTQPRSYHPVTLKSATFGELKSRRRRASFSLLDAETDVVACDIICRHRWWYTTDAEA